MKNWRDLWPGGLDERAYSTLNLMAECRGGGLGYNRAKCRGCGCSDWYASSCGDRHCPNCLGPRQARWSEDVCARLPDCAHFHVVFTVPAEFGEFFERNYRVAARELFAASAEVLKTFQRNNWGAEGGFLSVLHTWGSALNWHPHLHVLAGAGGADLETGRWRRTRSRYMFPVKAMSKVFRAVMLRRIEALDGQAGIAWPDGLETVEARRDWRLRLARRGWNIFSKPTLRNTRAVVRYLARYTSRIAMSNRRITRVDESERTVTFSWKDYRDGGREKERTLGGGRFLWSFARHLVPKGLRRVRYYGLLAGRKGRFMELPGAPRRSVGENATGEGHPSCPRCGCDRWAYTAFYQFGRRALSALAREAGRFSLGGPGAWPDPPPKQSNKRMNPTSDPPGADAPG